MIFQGEIFTADALESLRGTFNMLRDDACLWRFAATTSLLNGLTDLPKVGVQLQAVEPLATLDDNGAEEQKLDPKLIVSSSTTDLPRAATVFSIFPIPVRAIMIIFLM